jgi:imidazolonepropionase-like amidohydrolase
MLLRCFVLAVACCAAACFASPPPSLVIRDVTIIDVMNGRELPGMTVVVQGDEIQSVSRSPKVAEGTRVVDGAGKYLIPGLWDMHTHFTQHPSSLDLFVAHGITGVRDMGSLAVKRTGDSVQFLERDDAIRSIIDAREKVKRGEILGPVIFTPGIIVTGPNPADPSAPALPHQIVVRTPEEARETVTKLKRMGVDSIKVHARLSPECYQAIVEAAKHHQLPVEGHVPLSINPMIVSQAGQRSIEHVTGVWEYANIGMQRGMNPQRFQDQIQEFKKNQTWHVPTLVNYLAGAEAYRITREPASEPELDLVPPEILLQWKADWSLADFSPEQSKAFQTSVEILQEMVLEMSKGGVGIMAGSDCGGIFTYPGMSLHKELELLHEAGLTPLQTLQSATIRPAEFLGLSNRRGSVEKGKVADLVLLRANPLKNIKNTREIEAVVLGGRLLDRKALDGTMARVRARAKESRKLVETVPWVQRSESSVTGNLRSPCVHCRTR